MSFSYREQWEVLSKVALTEGQTKNISCPFCGGSNKLSISKTLEGVTLWNCYRASCSSRGSRQGKRTSESLSRALNSPTQPQVINHRVTPLPSVTKGFRNDPTAYQYILDNNCVEAYDSNYINIRYAPAEKRVLFYNNTETGCVGRSMANHRSKWWSYGDCQGGIAVGNGSTAVLVEDVASACSVSRLPNHVGLALLGTNITEHIKNTVRQYDNVYIVLDNDASKKAILLAKTLTGKVSVRLTKRDLKYLNVDQLEELL